MLHSRVSSAVLAALFGLLTALCFGVGNFVAQGLTGRTGWLRAALIVHALALPVVAAVALAVDGPPDLERAAVVHALGLGLLNVFSSLALYRAFAVGTLSIVAPIASSYAAVTVVLAALAGEAPGPALTVGLVAVLVGVVVVAAARGAPVPGARWRGAGVLWAGLSSMSLGAEFFWLEPVTHALGPLWPVVAMRAVGTAVLWPLRRVLRPKLHEPAGPLPWPWICACVILDTLGLVLYSVGTEHGEVAVVAVLASLSSVVTLVLARRRLRERLRSAQWSGVVLVLAGTAWVTYYSRG